VSFISSQFPLLHCPSPNHMHGFPLVPATLTQLVFVFWNVHTSLQILDIRDVKVLLAPAAGSYIDHLSVFPVEYFRVISDEHSAVPSGVLITRYTSSGIPTTSIALLLFSNNDTTSNSNTSKLEKMM
jgi:hypothetical protein